MINVIHTYQKKLKGEKVGIVFGTFAPLHQGHLDLIMRAKKECEGGCECFENKLAIFEDYVESIMVYEHEDVVFLVNCGSASFSDFGRTIFLKKEEAEEKLKELQSI